MSKVYLIGFMGTGKTAVGHRLAIQYEVDELDERFEQEHGKTITAFFAEHGEAGFRTHESELLKSSKAEVVVTGGGIVEREENRLYMQESGTVVWIDTPFDLVWERIASDPNRPLVTEREQVRRLFERRYSLYARVATVRLEGTASIEELTHAIETVLEEKS
ncbi:shikimate kinase [Exiguobacterium indicum]|uniref:shikimate kinase n=1 Tax=Exiguobacterium indicum TaxID=296995 RepID=UPI0007368BB5|nr:shikimate kinase [Exiguobacterium indicum]KTR60738.1 shikimate kinase [Exiguobacterium indicum]